MAKIIVNNQTAQKIYLTPEGLKEAQGELEFLKTEKRPQVSERITRAREFGNIDESAEYDAALDEQALVENRIAFLEETLRHAQVISEGMKSDIVAIGSKVRVKTDDGVSEFIIVGKVEANPTQKKISNESPLGSALLGLQKGEVVEVSTPTTKYKVKILEIK